MMTILSYILVGLTAFILAWFISRKIQINNFIAVIESNEREHDEEKAQLLAEQTIIADKFFKGNKLDLEQKGKKLNVAFLENGRTVELIAAELKSAQNVVDNAFASLPNIYTCSQKTKVATQTSKEKIDALTKSVDSWQGSMATLQAIQSLIDEIHGKAIQIRDVSAEANLLALNASIEAARAGEHGRGFAVVATSMRELSNKSAEATVEINYAVEKTRTEVGKIVEGISDSVGFLTEVSSNVTDSFAEIEEEVSNIDNISQVSLSEADLSKDKFKQINEQVNTQLENIVRLLADTLGEVTGVKIEDVSVKSDFSAMKIIDVRRPEEFSGELGHIEGAELICLQDSFEQQILRLDKKGAHLFVCRSGGRSARAARIALGTGFKNIYNMKGGMLEYCKVIGTPANASAAPSPPAASSKDGVTLF
ncbi:MAG: methyl-accepting chemotaxis protein [Methylococcaceae bacterium]